MEPFTCPRCKMILILPDHYAGTSFTCPNCKNEIQVPGSPDGQASNEETEEADAVISAARHQRCPGSLRTVLLAATSSGDSRLA